MQFACGYCYAKGGSFGAPATNMSGEIAEKAVRRLFDDVPVGDRVRLAFIGGEPLVNPAGDSKSNPAGVRTCRSAAARPRVPITSNGTLLQADDAEFFERLRVRRHHQHRRVRRDARSGASFCRRKGIVRSNHGEHSSAACRASVGCKSRRASASRRPYGIFETVSDLIRRGFIA